MNRLLIGFVWRQIPVISQHKLEREYRDDDWFMRWSQKVIEDYEQRCSEAASECARSVELLRAKGCKDVVVSPDAIGSLRLVLFDRLLKDLPAKSFLMVTSWGDFGTESMVLDCVDRALTKDIYVITEQHLSLMHLTDEHLDEAYRSLVRAQITGGYRIRRSRREKIDDLLAQGLTAIQVQERLKISKSTYYRLMSDDVTKLANAIARDFIKELNRPQ